MRVGLLLFACLAALMAAGGTLAAVAKPVIGKPKATPAQPQAGRKFAVAFHVAHDTSASFAVTLDGKALHHSDSFHGGTARSTVQVPAATTGEILAFELTARAGHAVATKSASFIVTQHAAAVPSISIGDVSTPEGNSGTTPFVFHVTLSHASSQKVTVDYGTEDGTATAPSDYAETDGTLTFDPGRTDATITVPVVGDTVVEPDETFDISLSGPSNATIAVGTGTATIVNDDTAAPATAGSYQGATQEGNYVYFSVGGDRTVSAFRVNDLPENCGGGVELSGSVNFGDLTIPVASDGSFLAQGNWSGSQTNGDTTFTAETWKITGQFTSATTVSGTIALADNMTWQGTNYSCSTNVTFTASLQG